MLTADELSSASDQNAQVLESIYPTELTVCRAYITLEPILS